MSPIALVRALEAVEIVAIAENCTTIRAQADYAGATARGAGIALASATGMPVHTLDTDAD
ncbi:MAG TPA: hypothetical protein VF778_03240 [Xanthobacteraceae bacterium]